MNTIILENIKTIFKRILLIIVYHEFTVYNCELILITALTNVTNEWLINGPLS